MIGVCELMAHTIEVVSVSKVFARGAGLRFWRGSGQLVQALLDVSLQVAPGEIYGLVGRNGYGKTTLVKCIGSLIEPSRGSIRVAGQDSARASSALRGTIGFAGADERSFYWRLTGLENLLFFARLQGIEERSARRKIDELCRRFGVAEILPRRFHEYATGNRQRLCLVRALLHDPTVLLLDEPTRSLDPFAAAHTRSALRRWVVEDPKRCALVTSHNLEEIAGLSDRVGIMSRGRLREQGTLAELRERHDSRELVRIWLDRAVDPNSWPNDGPGVEDLVPGDDPERGPFLELRRDRRDGVLDTVLRRIYADGARILSFDRVEMSLQDIIDRVDAGGDDRT